MEKKALKCSVIALLLILTSAFLVIPASAQQRITEIPTWLYITVSPNPVGVGQTVYVNTFFSKPLPTSGMANTGDMYENVTVRVTKPDGSVETYGPYVSDALGGVWFSFAPDQVGEWKLQAFYPGEVLDLKNSKNPNAAPLIFGGWTPLPVGAHVKPAQSEVITLVVQKEPVGYNYKTPPLPSEYWFRPIYSTNWEWAKNFGCGCWFGLSVPSFASTGGYDGMGNFNPYDKAPNTAHIVWTKPTHFGGQPGQPVPGDQMSQYMSTTIATSYFEPIILNGILYYTVYGGPTAQVTGWTAIDLRTGETVWEKPAGQTGNEVLRMGTLVRYHSIQEFGCWALLWSVDQPTSFFGQPTTYRIYDPFTGAYLAEIKNIRNLQNFILDWENEEAMGDLVGWYIDRGNLTKWSATNCFMSNNWARETYRPSGSYDWSAGVVWSKPIPSTYNGVPISLSIAAATPEVILLRYAPGPGMFVSTSFGWQITCGVDAATGALLWGPINQTIPYLQDISLLAARDGVYVLGNKDTHEVYGYSLKNGQQLWGPVKLPGNAWSVISWDAEIAYGKVIVWDYGGYVNALDKDTGKLLWSFNTGSSAYDTPYGTYVLWQFGTQSIADGKIFLSEGSMYNPPLHPAWRLAIDVETGQLVWKILSYSGRCPGAVADGFLVEWNSFDNQIYCFGKGPSRTIVEAKPAVTQVGEAVLIEGKVLDNSPGAKQHGIIERFQDGLPAVADEDMSPWMEYVYMQQIKPDVVGGVNVELYAIDETGQATYIDTVCTDPLNGGIFRLLWTPPKQGTYIISAVFRGTESYYSSNAQTTIGVSPKEPAPATPEQVAEQVSSQVTPIKSTIESQQSMINVLVALVVVAIIIGIVNMVFVIRRQK